MLKSIQERNVFAIVSNTDEDGREIAGERLILVMEYTGFPRPHAFFEEAKRVTDEKELILRGVLLKQHGYTLIYRDYEGKIMGICRPTHIWNIKDGDDLPKPGDWSVKSRRSPSTTDQGTDIKLSDKIKKINNIVKIELSPPMYIENGFIVVKSLDVSHGPKPNVGMNIIKKINKLLEFDFIDKVEIESEHTSTPSGDEIGSYLLIHIPE